MVIGPLPVRLKKAGKPPECAVPIGKEDSQTRLKRILNAGNVEIGKKYKMLEKVGQRIAKDMERVFVKYPKLASLETRYGDRGVLNGLGIGMKPLRGGRAAEYAVGARRIDIFSHMAIVMPESSLSLGRFNIGSSGTASFRHEFGHHLHQAMTGSDNYMKWNGMFRSKRKEWWSARVSKYGATDAAEAFSESFTAWTSPHYKAGMLPTEVEQYFKGLF